MNKILASLCYIQKNNKTLMLHRVKKKNDIHQNKYNGLGGKFEEGESPEDCVEREVFEESNLKIINPKFCGVLTFPKFDKKNDWIVFVFKANKFKGKIKECLEGDLVWVKNKDLLKLNLWEGDKIFLKELFKDKFFLGKFYYKNKKLVSYKIKTY